MTELVSFWGIFFLSLYFILIPLKLREVTVEQGLLTGSFENPKGIGTKVKYGNLLLFEELKKKIDGLELC